MFALSNSTLRCNQHLKPFVTVAVRHNHQPNHQPQIEGIYRGERTRRWGYEAHHHTKGLLPRLKIKERRIGTLPIKSKEDPWSTRQATMGQNDFLSVLTGQKHEQYDQLTHIPDWLRGYKGNNEYSVLMRKRKEFEHWRYTKPLKWLHLEQRIKFLYRHINNKYRPPDVEKLSKNRYV